MRNSDIDFSEIREGNPRSGMELRDLGAFLPVPAFLIFFIVFASGAVERPVESYVLLLILNTLFLSVLPLLVSYFLLRAYRQCGHLSLVMLGNGALGLGLGSMLAAVTPFFGGGPNTMVTIHNTAALLSALCNLSGAAWVLSGRQATSMPDRRGASVVLSGSFMALFFGVLFWGALKDLTPTFFVQESGPTYLRQVILGASIGCFTISASVLGSLFVISRSRFLSWYWMALALFATGLLSVFAQKLVGSDVGWLGRSAQYLGGAYLLAAALTASRELRDRNMCFMSNPWTLFFNRLEVMVALRTKEVAEVNEKLALEITARKEEEEVLKEREEAFRSIFENSFDGILFTGPDGSIFKANRTACAILGRSERELCQMGRNAVADTRDPRLASALRERSEKGLFCGELTFMRKEGNPFPVKVSSAHVP